MRGLTRWIGGLMLAATLAGLAGCASLPAAGGAPIADVSAIAGKWAGTVTPGDEPFYLTITPAGTLTAAWGGNMACGTVTIRNGKASFEMQPGIFEGTVTLYDDGGARRLVLNDQWATFNAQLVPR